METDGKMHGLVTWFDCHFSHGSKPICLSTSPYKKPTHWKQTVFYFDTPLQVSARDVVDGKIKVCKAKENPRELNVQIEYWLNGAEKGTQFYRIS